VPRKPRLKMVYDIQSALDYFHRLEGRDGKEKKRKEEKGGKKRGVWRRFVESPFCKDSIALVAFSQDQH